MGAIGEDFWLSRLALLVPLWLSLTVHEWAHAACAFRLGDTTAAAEGRMTLNPLDHIDPIGTLALPLLGVPFGWAKPVPIVPARFHAGISMRTGLVLTAAAGPLSNLVVAIAASVALGLAARLGASTGAAVDLLETTVFLNVILALFNMLPIPPLDGSRIVDGLVPDAWRGAWNEFGRMAPFALGIVIAAPLLLGVSPFAGPLHIVSVWLGAVRSLLAG